MAMAGKVLQESHRRWEDMHGGQGASKWRIGVEGALPSAGWPGAYVF